MTGPRPATVVDVARRAGVGKSTVPNALRGTGRVSERTCETVLAAARELGYVPNAAARRLRGGETGAIGVHPARPTTRSSCSACSSTRCAATGTSRSSPAPARRGSTG